MKRTEYFMTKGSFANAEKLLSSVLAERDSFLHQNRQLVGEIDREDISVTNTSINGGNSNVIFIIKLTYFPKEAT